MSNSNGLKKIGIEVKVTERCNQNCIYCVNSDGGVAGRDMDHTVLIQRLKEWHRSAEHSAWVIKEVRITGGEPLMNESGTTAIIAACGSAGIIPGINTNGSLMTNDMAGRLKDAGMRVVKISLDTLNPDLYMKICGTGASLEDVLNGIRVALESGFRVIIRFTLSALNKHELVGCYRYAVSTGVSGFQVKPLIAAGRGKKCSERLSRRELLQAIRGLSDEVDNRSCLPEILCFLPEDAFGLPARACGSTRKIYISTNGQVGTCNYLSGGMIGDISSQSLEEIFEARSLFAKTVKHNNHMVLAGCPQYERS